MILTCTKCGESYMGGMPHICQESNVNIFTRQGCPPFLVPLIRKELEARRRELAKVDKPFDLITSVKKRK